MDLSSEPYSHAAASVPDLCPARAGRCRHAFLRYIIAKMERICINPLYEKVFTDSMHNSFPLGHRRCRFDLPSLEKVEGGGVFVTEAVFGRIISRLHQGSHMARCLNEDTAGGVLCCLG